MPTVDDPFGDVDELDVLLLAELSQHLEGSYVVRSVALHDDSLGLTDSVTAEQRGLQLFFLLGGDDRGGGVRREHTADGFGVGVPLTGPEAEQVERSCGPVTGVQLERQ